MDWKVLIEVKKIVFDANYLVMGLGDVYLGAPVATPLDPRHRLVTTKYNPARTWTPENAVGIGGAYMCVYGMEGPGGYQFVGRTVQMWNRYRQTANFIDEKPWLLRFFDQIKFYEVSADELHQMREDFPRGRVELKLKRRHSVLGNIKRSLRAMKNQLILLKRHSKRHLKKNVRCGNVPGLRTLVQKVLILKYRLWKRLKSVKMMK